MMATIQENAEQGHAKGVHSALEAAVDGLAPESPEYSAAFQQALDDIAATVTGEVHQRSAWDFSAEKALAVLAKDDVVILRPIQPTDADFYVKVKAQYSMMYRAVIHLNKVDNESLIMADIILKPELFFCIIADAKDGTPVGYVGINDTRKDVWEIAIELDGQFTHKGFGARSIRLFLNELHRITGRTDFMALVDTDNRPSQGCFEKVGAQLTGLHHGPFLKLEDEKRRFEERNLHLIDSHMEELASRLGVEPRLLLSHVLEYHIQCPLIF